LVSVETVALALGAVLVSTVVVELVLSGVVVLLATGGGVVVLGTTTVVSFVVDAVGAGVVVEVVVVRSHAASDTPRVRAATRGISFMISPYGWVKPNVEMAALQDEFHRCPRNGSLRRAATTRGQERSYTAR
jgi:hypothetical protein